MAGKKKSQQTGKYSKANNPQGLSRRAQITIRDTLRYQLGGPNSKHDIRYFRKNHPQEYQQAVDNWLASQKLTSSVKANAAKYLNALTGVKQNYHNYMFTNPQMAQDAANWAKKKGIPDYRRSDTVYYRDPKTGLKYHPDSTDYWTGFNGPVDSSTPLVQFLARNSSGSASRIADLINADRVYNNMNPFYRWQYIGQDYLRMKEELDKYLRQANEKSPWTHAQIWDLIIGYPVPQER